MMQDLKNGKIEKKLDDKIQEDISMDNDETTSLEMQNGET